MTIILPFPVIPAKAGMTLFLLSYIRAKLYSGVHRGKERRNRRARNRHPATFIARALSSYFMPFNSGGI